MVKIISIAPSCNFRLEEPGHDAVLLKHPVSLVRLFYRGALFAPVARTVVMVTGQLVRLCGWTPAPSDGGLGRRSGRLPPSRAPPPAPSDVGLRRGPGPAAPRAVRRWTEEEGRPAP